jgi:Ser/Thr protein kinase RdoA (MazF antagonist)
MNAELAASHWSGRIIRLIGHRENAVYEMATPDGRAALRLHRAGYQGADAIRSELWLTDALARSGAAVAAPLAARSGAFVVEAGDHLATAIAWVPGEALGEAGVPLPGSKADQEARHFRLGRLLADLHRATAALDLPEWFARPRWDVDGLTGEAPFWGRFWEHPALTDTEAAVLCAARRALRDWLSARHERLAPIHADVLRENVLCDGDRMTLIDFDDCGIGFRGYDLGTVMSQNLYEPARDDLKAALIAGYGSLGEGDVDMFTLARVCASVGWAAPRLPPGHPVHRSHIARAVMWARTLAV